MIIIIVGNCSSRLFSSTLPNASAPQKNIKCSGIIKPARQRVCVCCLKARLARNGARSENITRTGEVVAT